MQYMRRNGLAAAFGMLVLSWLGNTFALDATAADRFPPPVLDATELPATGTQHTLLHIAAFGRYTVIAKSAQGTALQLIDRMSGPGPINGLPGKEDGRLDVFLNRGDYKLQTLASNQGSGQVALSVYRAKEMSPSLAPRIVEFRLENTTLADLQQRSYWLNLEQRRKVVIEAAGRNLADLRIWKDGNWLVDAQPKSDIITPQSGKPLGHQLLVAELNPGLYLLSAYGGPEQPWAETADEHPFYLRMGIPELGAVERRHHITSPFGIDRWRVPAEPNYFRIELPKAEAAELGLRTYEEARPFAEPELKSAVSKKSIPPVAELRSSTSNRWRILSVRREAGQPYILQFFDESRYKTIGYQRNPIRYWVETVHSGHAEDHIDTTAILTQYQSNRYHDFMFVASTAITLDSSQQWRRRFNLLNNATLFFEIKHAGLYRFAAEGVNPGMRIEPFFISTPWRYKAPALSLGALEKELDPGFYVLTLSVGNGINGKGVVTLSAGLSGAESPAEEADAQIAFLNPQLSVAPRTSYRIDLNQQPGVAQGIILRRLPIDLSSALPVAQAAHQAIATEISIGEPGTVAAIDENGQRLMFSIDGAAPVSEKALKPGTYSIAINNESEHALNYTITTLPQRIDPNYPQPAISYRELNTRPKLPLLGEKDPYFYDTERDQRETVNIVVPKDGLYRVESTGLMQMAGMLRTRTITRFDSQRANGVGRNFFIAQYLREGDYQLTAQPEGQSRGPLSLRLARTNLFDGGLLTAKNVARHTLRAGDGLLYHFHIETAGRYRIHTLGLIGRRFTARLEDADGWPLLPPGIDADVSRWFEPGDYRFIVLPQPVEARAITLFEPIEAAPSFQGHGPHAITLGQGINHQWLEPQGDDAVRTPDQWTFTVPADINATISMTPAMQGTLMRDGETLAQIAGAQGWSGSLSAGAYLLEMRSQRPNNRLDYGFSVQSDQLIAGQTRDIRVPADISVAIGSRSPFELSSFGAQDVRARLFDSNGALLASNDDRPDDWNFYIGAQLAPGNYRLNVTPVTTGAAQTTVSLRVPEILHENPLRLPVQETIRDINLHYYPLPAAKSGQLWVFAARCEDEVALAIEHQQEGHWNTIGEMNGKAPVVIVPIAASAAAGEYRLRLRSIARSGHAIDLHGDLAMVSHQNESALSGAGATLTALTGFSPALGIAVVDLDRPGQFAVARTNDGLLWGSRANKGLVSLDRGRINAGSNTLWLARVLNAAGTARVPASRLVLTAKTPLPMTLTQGQESVLNLEQLQGGAIQIAIATSPIGLPGIRNWPQADAMVNAGVGRRSAVLIQRDVTQANVALWGVSGDFLELPVQMSLFEFTGGKSESVGVGMHDLSLAPSAVLTLSLPTDGKHLTLSLPPGVVAELHTRNTSLATYWSESSSQSFSIDTAADALSLYNTRPQAGRAALRVAPGESTDGMLTSETFGKRLFAAAGIDTLRVVLSRQDKAVGRHLHVLGADAELTVIEQSGRILRGEDIVLHDDARVLIAHGRGVLTAWLSDAQGNTRITNDASAATLHLPARLALDGQRRAYHLNMAAPGAVAVDIDTPVIIRVRSPGIAERIQVFDGATRLPLYLDKGEHTLFIESPGAAPLGGRLDAYALAIDKLKEGLSEKRMLAPGDARFYHIHIDQERTVGIGAKASLDTVNCTLFDKRGVELGRGLLQMHTLKAGDYLLRVEAPDDGEAVEVQGALVGVTLPDSGPPAEVIERYLQAAGLKNH